jgi:mannose-6-phosphate isomerase-like protein (cupin superfamily)
MREVSEVPEVLPESGMEKSFMKTILYVAIIGTASFPVCGHAEKPQGPAQGAKADMPEPIFKLYKDLKWEKLIPDLEGSPEICTLHVDPKTKASKLLIRCPKAMGARKHWHTANETHTVILGQVIYECDGKRVQLGQGSFNYIPSKMVHEAWSSAGSLVFITVDGPWDLHHTDGAPTAADVIKDPKAFFAEPSK